MVDKPNYNPSPYSAPASADLFNFFDPRLRGQNIGFSDEDMSAMKSRAVENANYSVDEAVRRGANARRTPGGIKTGGMDTMRENAVNSALAVRSGALQDLAVQNAVLKHQDQWNAASGMQGFLNEQDQAALHLYGIQSQMWAQELQNETLTNMYKKQYSAMNQFMSGLGQGVGMFGSYAATGGASSVKGV